MLTSQLEWLTLQNLQRHCSELLQSRQPDQKSLLPKQKMPTAELEKVNTSEVSWLSYQWVAAGIISAAARFIPIPFVDETVQRRCRRYVVQKTLATNSSDIPVEQLKPLYDPDHSIFSWIIRAPLKLILFPVRKIVKIVTSVRGVPLEILNVFLLGRTLNRYLDDNHSLRPEKAEDFEKAFRKAFGQMDFRIAKAAVRDILNSVQSWKSEAKKEAAEIRQQKDPSPSPEQIAHVEGSAKLISEAFDRPELAKIFQRFDTRFDQLFGRA